MPLNAAPSRWGADASAGGEAGACALLEGSGIVSEPWKLNRMPEPGIQAGIVRARKLPQVGLGLRTRVYFSCQGPPLTIPIGGCSPSHHGPATSNPLRMVSLWCIRLPVVPAETPRFPCACLIWRRSVPLLERLLDPVLGGQERLGGVKFAVAPYLRPSKVSDLRALFPPTDTSRQAPRQQFHSPQHVPRPRIQARHR